MVLHSLELGTNLRLWLCTEFWFIGCERSVRDLLTDACAFSKSSPVLAEWNSEGFGTLGSLLSWNSRLGCSVLTGARTYPLGLQTKSWKSMSTFFCWVRNSRTGTNILGCEYQGRNMNLNRNGAALLGSFPHGRTTSKGEEGHQCSGTCCSVEPSHVLVLMYCA